jgi:hypothetical protein
LAFFPILSIFTSVNMGARKFVTGRRNLEATKRRACLLLVDS